MATNNPYANPSARLKFLAGTFAFAAWAMLIQVSGNVEAVQAMLIG
jgi:hypothetical protein